MPPLETMDRNQHAVYWARQTYNGRPKSDKHSKPLVSAPVDVMVQWDDSYTQQRDAKNNKVDVDGTLFTNMTVAIGSVFWLGTVATLPSFELNPQAMLNLLEVVYVNVTPDLKGRVQSYELGVKKFTDQIPVT